MNVYRVRTLSDSHRRLAIDQRGKTPEDIVQIGKLVGCRGVPKTVWDPPNMHLGNPLKPEPDFWECEIAGSFAVHPRALDIVSMFLDRAGQLLPLKFKDIEFTVLNVLEVYDCIDPDRSEWYTMPNTGERYAVKTPFFVPQHFERSTLFKFPTRTLEIFCWENTREPEDEFKACVEDNGLTGLEFELIWTDEKQRRKSRKR